MKRGKRKIGKYRGKAREKEGKEGKRLQREENGKISKNEENEIIKS